MTVHHFNCFICGAPTTCYDESYLLGLDARDDLLHEDPRNLNVCSIECVEKLIAAIKWRVVAIRDGGEHLEWADRIEAAFDTPLK